jgi:hypothetical protein
MLTYRSAQDVDGSNELSSASLNHSEKDIAYQLFSTDNLNNAFLEQISNVSESITQNFLNDIYLRFKIYRDKFTLNNDIDSLNTLSNLESKFISDNFSLIASKFDFNEESLEEIKELSTPSELKDLLIAMYTMFIIRKKYHMISFLKNQISLRNTDIVEFCKTRVDRKDIDIFCTRTKVNSLNAAYLVSCIDLVIDFVINNFNLTVSDRSFIEIMSEEFLDDYYVSVCNKYLPDFEPLTIANTFFKSFKSDISLNVAITNEIKLWILESFKN